MRHMNHPTRSMALAAASGALILSAVVGWAADPRLDLAYETLVKARALVAASEDPGASKPFGGHAQKAINAIDRALQEVQLAKQAADSHS